MKKKLILLLSLLSISAFANQTVGIAGYYKESAYHTNSQINVLPIANLSHKNFYLKGTKIGYTIYKEPNLKISLMGDFLGGYTDFAIRKSELKKGFNNIESRKTQLMGGLALDFKLDRTILGHISYTVGGKGSKGDIKISKIFPITDRLTFIPAVFASYYSSKYMNYYIGLTEEDVKNNVKINKTYKGKDIGSVGVNSTIEICLTEQVTASVFAGYEYYSNKIKKSDLIKDNKQIYGGIGIRYSF